MSIRFSVKPVVFAVVLIATGGLLGACGGGAASQGPRTIVSAPNAYLLTSANRIFGVDLNDTEFARQGSTLGPPLGFGIATNTVNEGQTGFVEDALEKDEQVLAIDYRNSEGRLYALTRLGTEGRIIIITPQTGAVIRVSTLIADQSDTYSALSPLASFTINFDPTLDRLRVIGSDKTNYRVDVLTGETITDGAINSAVSIAGVAYTDVFTAAEGRTTTLFGIDLAQDLLYTIANDGTLSASKTLGIGDVTSVNGFDIDPTNNTLTAVMTVAVAGATSTGIVSVFSIDATAANTVATRRTSLPKLPGTETYQSLALVTRANPTVVVLDANNKLSILRANEPEVVFTPGTVSGTSTVTLGDSGSLIGIDFRQSSRKLIGLSSQGNYFALTVPVNGTVGPTVSAQINNSASTALSLESSSYTIDFDPLITNPKNLRLIGSDNSNAVVVVEDGGSTREEPISKANSGSDFPSVAAAAYSNNFRNALATGLFVIDRFNSAVATQTINNPNPATPAVPADPNTPQNGQLTNSLALGITLDSNSPVGFDISGRGNDNLLLMARTWPNVPFTLYRLNLILAGDRLLPLGIIGGSTGPTTLIDIAIAF